MNETGYFDNGNYTSNHLHVDNYTDEFTPYIEAIVWERRDGTMDLFFDDFKNEKELTDYSVIRNTIILNLWVYSLVMLSQIKRLMIYFVIGWIQCFTHIETC